MYQIKSVTLTPVILTLKQSFKTAHTETKRRPLTIVQVTLFDHLTQQEVMGYGEIQSFDDFTYAPENQIMSLSIVQNILLPQLQDYQFKSPEEFAGRLNTLTAYGSFAKSGLEMAIWDAVGHLKKKSLQRLIGGTGTKVPVSVAIGLADDFKAMMQAQYQRHKLKIDGATNDWQKLIDLLLDYPNQHFSIDANCSFRDEDFSFLAALPDNVDFIEQPYSANDFVKHAQLQARIQQHLSLDESVNNIDDIATMLDLHAANALTVKQGKIGGISNAIMAIKMVDKPWIGGMLTSGLGRSVDLALASLPNIAFPSDISDSSRYFERDIIKEKLVVDRGYITVPTGFGIGVTMDFDAIADMQSANTINIQY